jgi:hypothetical protein
METRVYNIDSCDRNKDFNPNSNYFIFTEKNTGDIQPFQLNNIINITLKNLILPNSIHFINSTKGNNVFTVDGTTVTINSGSYTISDLLNELNNNSVLSGKSLSFSYTNYTGKLTITNTSGSAVDFQFPDIDIYNNDSLKNILGFRNESFDTNINISNGTTTLNFPMENAIEKYFFIRINDLGNIYYKNYQYMTKIYSEGKYRYDDINLSMSYNYTSPTFTFNQPTDIKEFKISIVDKYNNLIDLNYLDYSFTLEINMVYNSVLKRYYESITYSDDVMQKILNKKMLEYYESKLEDNKIIDNKIIDNNNIILNDLNEFNYDNNINIINNQIENSSFFD